MIKSQILAISVIISLLFYGGATQDDTTTTPSGATPNATINSAEEASFFPNIDYLSRGYNIYKGYPLTPLGDPGFSDNTLMDFDYTKGRQTADRRYQLPDFVNVIVQQSCSLTFNSEQITGESSLTKALQVDVSISGGGWFGGEFKASSSYQTKSTDTASREYVYINTRAECIVYKASIESGFSPRISDSLMQSVNDLKSMSFSSAPQQYFNLIESFGTHSVTELLMGAKYGVTSKFTREAVSSLRQSGYSLTAAASYSGLFSAGFSGGTSSDQTAANSFNQARDSEEVYSVGSVPKSDAGTWANQNFADPFPVKYTLKPLDQFLMNYFTQNQTLQQYQLVVDGVALALQNYCKDFLLPAGRVTNCNTPSPDGVALFSNMCRLCHGSCGNGYNQVSGIIQSDSTDANFV